MEQRWLELWPAVMNLQKGYRGSPNRTGARCRVYEHRLVSGKVMMPADLKRLHMFLLEVEHIEQISDEMRDVIESEWPELALFNDAKLVRPRCVPLAEPRPRTHYDDQRSSLA